MITRKQIEECKGMDIRHMKLFCPDRLEVIREIVGVGKCLHSNPERTSPLWYITGDTPMYKDWPAYFPTPEQLDAYFAPKSKFEVGSVWLCKGIDEVVKITGANEATLLYSPYKTSGQTVCICKLSSTNVSFYEPWSQERLDAEGYEIAEIRVPVYGDEFISYAGFLHRCEHRFDTNWTKFYGLRYILKKKKEKCLLKEAIRLLKEISLPVEMEEEFTNIATAIKLLDNM